MDIMELDRESDFVGVAHPLLCDTAVWKTWE